MFESTVADGVFQLSAPDTRWLSTGWNGGYRIADAAYNVSVPEGWHREDLREYVRERRERAGFDESGPVLLTGVDLAHARGARMDSVVVYATVGVSNPASLPTDEDALKSSSSSSFSSTSPSSKPSEVGTVNLVVGSTRPLIDGALATLVGTAVEAKTATLLSLTGFTGTTTDAVVAGAPSTGDGVQWAGSGTELGNATRVCVRDAVRASFRSRYADASVPASVADAEHGVVSDGAPEVFEP